jgi:hypothetical protein
MSYGFQKGLWRTPKGVAAWFISRATRNLSGCLISHVKYPNYPIAKLNGKMTGVHRIVFIAANGPIPEGAFILHSCDNKKCLEITHLRLGSPQENMEDMIRKGRGANQWKRKPANATP